MNYHPQGLYVWDTWYLHWEGITHCFHLQQIRPGLPPSGVSKRDFSNEHGAIGHAISKDLIEWETLPSALYPGKQDDFDNYELWTGSCIAYKGKYYLFYTGRCSKEKGTINRIGLAISENGIHWTRYDKNPIITATSHWYCNEKKPRIHNRYLWPTVDLRDLCVVADPEGKGFWGFFAARQPANEITLTAVIGLCYSDNLIDWKLRPPCFTPGRYACIEVPDVFFLNGLWYMICMTGNIYGQRNRVCESNLRGLVSIYSVSHKIEGPYHELDKNILIGAENNQGFSARTVEVDGDRYLFYTQAEELSGSNFGSVSIPKILRTDINGHLLPCWSNKIEKYFRETLIDANHMKVVRTGRDWGSLCHYEQKEGGFYCGCQHDWAVCLFESWGQNFLYSARLSIDDARSAGLIFRVQGKSIYEGAYIVLLDAIANEVVFTQPVGFPRIENREWEINPGTPYNLKVMFIDAIVNVFIDDILVLQLYHPEISGGQFGLFIEQGNASFSDVSAVRIG